MSEHENLLRLLRRIAECGEHGLLTLRYYVREKLAQLRDAEPTALQARSPWPV